jgi:L-threonylcarbamoyladenylate synthase
VDTGIPPDSASALRAPGQLTSHYAPKTPLFLHDTMANIPFNPDEAYLFFDEETLGAWKMRNVTGGRIFTLTNGTDKGIADRTLEAAANLFDMLHIIDKIKASAIHAQKAPDSGLGTAINDRLARAAAKRMYHLTGVDGKQHIVHMPQSLI